jgi:hypothetical protein
VTIDEKLQELDDTLREAKACTAAIAIRAFDVELTEVVGLLEAARLLVAGVRIELNFVKERLE